MTLQWEAKAVGKQLLIELHGRIDERADLTRLAEEIKSSDNVRLDCFDIARVNSIGVRDWVNFIRALPATIRITMERCSPAMVAQFNMIKNFTGRAQVESVSAPFICDSCGQQTNLIVNVMDRIAPRLRAPECSSCGVTMDFLGHDYFAFLDS